MLIPCYVALTVTVLFLCFAERRWPAQDLPEIPAWWPRVIGVNLVSLVLMISVSTVWYFIPSDWHLLDLKSRNAPLRNGVICWLFLAFVNYWWHRARHDSNFCWRWFHQIHHSVSRLEIAVSYYRNPLDTVLQGAFVASTLILVLGAGLQEITVAACLTAACEVYFHSNINVPVWASYIIQSPLAHRIHHMRGRGTHNFGDIPILTDIPFGTFKNTHPGKSVTMGFPMEQELRLRDMMLGVDVQAD